MGQPDDEPIQPMIPPSINAPIPFEEEMEEEDIVAEDERYGDINGIEQ
jgi:hypothetical protein